MNNPRRQQASIPPVPPAPLAESLTWKMGVVESLDPHIGVRIGTSITPARRAKSCLVAPSLGDKVVCAVDDEGVFVTAVLGQEAPESGPRPRSNTRIAVTGELTIAADKVAVTTPDMAIRAKRGSVAVEELGFFGRLVQAQASKIAILAEEMDSVAKRVSQKAERVFRTVLDIDQTRAGSVDVRAEKLAAIRAENTVLSARVLAKVDGEQIHIG